jgi:DNA-directed RNA polymerase subunit RPC12/RpoP
MVMRGEKRPKGDGWRRATVGNAAFNNHYQRIFCEDCRHHLIIHAQDLIDLHRVPAEIPFWTLAQRLVCGKCGSKKSG